MPSESPHSDVRLDPFGGYAVLVAPSRAARPSEFTWPEPVRVESICPFCPGNEHLTTPPVHAVPQDGPWKVRVVPNKYPAIEARAEQAGGHEVIIETPRHSGDFGQRSTAELRLLIEAWIARLAFWSARTGIRHCTIVRNVGHRAGGTLSHPHSQLFALPVAPPATVLRCHREFEHHRDTGQTLVGSLIGRAEAQGRVVLATQHFCTFVPWAARQPYELTTAARAHLTSSTAFDASHVADLATHVKSVQSALAEATDGGAYNLWFEEPPLPPISRRRSGETSAGEDTLAPVANTSAHHWCMSWMPRRSTTGGFEWATGCHINAVPPVRAAETVRQYIRSTSAETQHA